MRYVSRKQSPGVVASAAALSLLLPGESSAQNVARSGQVPQRHGCAELSTMPTLLATTPEGRSVMRLQRELEVAAQIAAKRGDGPSDIRGIVMAQKGVDSLMQVIVQQLGDGTSATIIVRGDSAGRSEFDRVARSRIEASIREMQPRVAALSGAVGGGGGRIVPGPLGESGWVGLRVSGSFFREVAGNGLVTRYCGDYPVIEAVDPGSPAEKGGLQAGDTLLAFNNRDVLAQPIVHSQTFVPGQQLRVKYRRDSKTREVPLVVAEARNEFRLEFQTPLAAKFCPEASCARTWIKDSVIAFRTSPLEVGGTMQPSRTVARAGAMPGTPPVPAVGMIMRDFGATMVGGAQLTVVGEELSQTLGVEQGLLVLRVLTGTPMAEAGLKVGDIVRQINGNAARDLLSLQRAFSAPSREVRLHVVSKAQGGRQVVVKW